ncbi:hypothetical protein [Spongiivirga citrea]|uniref:Vitamin uptake-like sensor domain-containing protein n=1 Tax=Spongiivirga citrea TaxID=1481457 RepID=A0A6M0CQ95_9FLAO|nr:hypothetical protein [Spongiivirga citrea]NER17667.1 hypothetical protein [Spongiivirga citrea]
MDSFSSLNFALLISLYISIAFFVSLIFKLRTKLGIGILFAGIGAFQFLQTYLTNTIQIQIDSFLTISPGTILFNASLFAVLILFVKEGAARARSLLYALLITNLFLCAIQYFIGLSFPESPMANLFNTDSIAIGIKTFSLGTILLFLDGLLVFFLYNQISRKLNGFFKKAVIIMTLVFFFDAFVFLTVIQGVELNSNFLNSTILKAFLSSLIYSVLFALYLKFFEKSKFVKGNSYSLSTYFSFLLYRGELENIQKKLAHQEKVFSDELVASETRFQLASELANLGYWQFNAQNKVFLLNDQLLKIYRTPLESIGSYLLSIKDYIDQFIPKEEQAAFISKLDSIDFGQAPSRSEIKHKVAFGDGSQGYVITVILTEKDSSTNEIKVHGITRATR